MKAMLLEQLQSELQLRTGDKPQVKLHQEHSWVKACVAGTR